MTTEINKELLIEIRKAVDYEMNAGINPSDLATDMGISRTNVFKLRKDQYVPKTARLIQKVTDWYQRWQIEQKKSQVEQEEVRSLFVETETARQVIATLKYAHAFKDMVMIVGGAGCGKTTSITEYRNRFGHTHLVECTPNNATKGGILRAISKQLGLHIPRGNVDVLEASIVNNLKNTDSFLILDESQFLVLAAIETVRRIHDETGIGVALVGNEKVHTQMVGTRSATEYAQLFSRIGKQLKLGKPRKNDILALIERYEFGDHEKELMVSIGKQPGALRGVNKVIRMAQMFAKNEHIEARHLQAAWADLSGKQLKTA